MSFLLCYHVLFTVIFLPNVSSPANCHYRTSVPLTISFPLLWNDSFVSATDKEHTDGSGGASGSAGVFHAALEAARGEVVFKKRSGACPRPCFH